MQVCPKYTLGWVLLTHQGLACEFDAYSLPLESSPGPLEAAVPMEGQVPSGPHPVSSAAPSLLLLAQLGAGHSCSNPVTRAQTAPDNTNMVWAITPSL